jgi:hypothetical protein
MSDTTTDTTPSATDKGLFARFAGVLFSPRETFAAVAARPRPFSMLLLVLGVTVLLTGGFMFTSVGQQTVLDSIERTGNTQQLEAMRQFAPYLGYMVVVQVLIVSPLLLLAVSGLIMAVFTVLMGGDAKFKQVFSVVVHSGAVSVLGQLVTVPLSYLTRSSNIATNASVFLPMLDDKSFLYYLANKIDLFTIWFVVALSIGLGVLYRRKTGPIAVGFFVIYGLIALGIAAFQAARS